MKRCSQTTQTSVSGHSIGKEKQYNFQRRSIGKILTNLLFFLIYLFLKLIIYFTLKHCIGFAIH